MRYFLDTEYDGFGGRLISLALVGESGGDEFYIVIDGEPVRDAWVERHVMPFLDMVPDSMKAPHLSRAVAADALAGWLAHDDDIEVIADWPEDLAHFSMLLVNGPGKMVTVPGFRLRFVSLHGFSTAANSTVPHNALHDARALRDHVTKLLE